MALGKVLSPFRAWKYLFHDPVTVRDPLNERPGSARYRGFHQNDTEKCIGCGTCEAICQNHAIDMVEVVGHDAKQGDSGLRPRIDYGRCCWCALCVDICMTGSLTMSNSYKWVDADADVFRFVPGIDEKQWDDDELGYERPDGHTLNARERIAMQELEPEARIGNFQEIVAGYDVATALLEADRCVECGLCVATCPAHMAVPQYIKAIRDGEYERGLALLYETNPFSQTCGRVCTHACETACAARHEGDPIAIRWLKRHITDHVAPEDVVRIVGKPKKPARGAAKKVAIVGGGPAGMTAAFDLARQGNKITVYEAREYPGGMLRYGIPEYRLPYDIIDREIDVIRAMGVEIVCDTRVGEDVTMDRLKAEFDAVILAIGLHLGRSTRIPGADHADVRKAVDLLRQVTDETAIDVPRRAVVIGGGNVAMDIARTMARLQKQAYDVIAVTVTALEGRDQFLADPEEVRECIEEGIEIIDARGPQEIVIGKTGKIEGLRTWNVLSIFDDQGRFAPCYDDCDERLHEGDMVIEAIGQSAGVDMLGDDLTEVLEWNRGRLAVDDHGRTSEPWLWAVGDCVNGPDVIHAVADGHRAASSIHAVFQNKEAEK